MAKKKKASESTTIMDKSAPYTPSKILMSTKLNSPTIPTYDRRHTTGIREGKISGEAFCRDPQRRKELGMSPLPTEQSDFIDQLRA